MTLKEIDNEISRLQSLKRDIQEEERKKDMEKSEQFVGKCYKDNDGEIFKIISAPRMRMYLNGHAYDKNQFVAVYLQHPNPITRYCIIDDFDEHVPFYVDTIYFDIESGRPNYPDFYEISPEEFSEEFDKCVKYYKELISV